MAHRKPSLGLTPLTIAIVAMATPATLALSLYMITEDPRLRPLAQTVEDTWFFPGERKPLVAIISWPMNTEVAGANAMADYVKQSIKAKGIHAKVTVVGTQGPAQIIYRIGSNTIGPFPLAAAVDGVQGAVAADWRPSDAREGDAL